MSGDGSHQAHQSLLIRPPWIDRTRVLDKALSCLTTVYPGEGLGAFLLGAVVFALLTSFYVLKTVRETIILETGGAEIKSYAAAAQSLLLLFVVPVYGLIASRLDRVRLITSVNLFFLSHLLLFAAAAATGVSIGVAFYVWLGVFNVMVIAQAWAFATDVYSAEQGQRLFPLIGVGSALGALAGSAMSAPLLKGAGVPGTLVAITALLLIGLGGIALVNRYVCACGGPQSIIAHLHNGKDGGLELLMKSRYLLLIAMLTAVANLASSSSDFVMGRMVTDAALRVPQEQRSDFISGYYAHYFSLVSGLALVIQLFIVPRAFHYLGIVGSLFVLPVLALVTGFFALDGHGLTTVRAMKIAEGSVEYSLQTTAANALFLGASRVAKYKAKSAIDAFFFRTGDLIFAAVVSMGAAWAFSVPQYAAINLAIVVVWLFVVLSLRRELKERKPRWMAVANTRQ
ncbi:MAG TPA: hypothetical protein VES20_05810 [Bryobacteraceae bacterium]|nr:hypothetical protein [Bryobacteraceae bacterium]